MGPKAATTATATTPPTDGLQDVIFGKAAAPSSGSGADGEGDDDPEHDDDDDGAPGASAADGEAAEGLEDDEEDEDADPAADEGADDDGADEDEEDEDESEAAKKARSSFTPEQQAVFNKAMKAERKKRETQLSEASEKIARLERDLADKGAARPAAPTAEDPLADVETEAQLEERIAGAKAWRSWLRTHPDGGTVGQGDKAKEVTPEQAREWLVFYEDILVEHAPARRAAIAKRQEADAAALKVHPWLAKAADPRTAAVEAELRAQPALRSVPGIRGLVADALVTRQAREAAAKKAKAGAPGTGKPGVGARSPVNPAATGARPPKVTKGGTTAKAAKVLAETGDDPNNAVLGNALFPGR